MDEMKRKKDGLGETQLLDINHLNLTFLFLDCTKTNVYNNNNILIFLLEQVHNYLRVMYVIVLLISYPWRMIISHIYVRPSSTLERSRTIYVPQLHICIISS